MKAGICLPQSYLRKSWVGWNVSICGLEKTTFRLHGRGTRTPYTTGSEINSPMWKALSWLALMLTEGVIRAESAPHVLLLLGGCHRSQLLLFSILGQFLRIYFVPPEQNNMEKGRCDHDIRVYNCLTPEICTEKWAKSPKGKRFAKLLYGFKEDRKIPVLILCSGDEVPTGLRDQPFSYRLNPIKLYSFKQGRLLEEGSEQARKTSIPAWSQAAYQSEGNLFGEARSTYIEYWLSRNDVYTDECIITYITDSYGWGILYRSGITLRLLLLR